MTETTIQNEIVETPVVASKGVDYASMTTKQLENRVKYFAIRTKKGREKAAEAKKRARLVGIVKSYEAKADKKKAAKAA